MLFSRQELATNNLTLFTYKSDGRLPDPTATQRFNVNAMAREEARVDRLAQDMVALHEEWAEIDALQASASKVAEKPRVGKRMVVK